MTENTIILSSPFGKDVPFDDQEEHAFPDLLFSIPGVDKPLKLHRPKLACASAILEGLLHSQESCYGKYDPNTHKIMWMFDRSSSDLKYRSVLLKCLRFCYGEDQTFTTEDCPAAVAVIFQLQLKGYKDIIEKILGFMTEITKSMPEVGVKMLFDCITYEECCCSEAGSADRRLANALFTPTNIKINFDIIVSGCLMKLPPEFLNEAEYEESPGEYSEFNIHRLYVKCNEGKLNADAVKEIMTHYRKPLKSVELKQLQEMRILNERELLELCQASLEETENNLTAKKKRLNDVNSSLAEKDLEIKQMRQRLAEMEREGLRRVLSGSEKKETKEMIVKLNAHFPGIETESELSCKLDSWSSEFEGLCVLLKRNAIPLRMLELRDCKMNEFRAQFLASALNENTTLTRLCCLRNTIGELGSRSFGFSLKNNTSLTTLKLDGCDTGDKGAEWICEGLKENTTLRKLHLESCRVGNEGAKWIGDLLKHNTTIITINLSFNKIGCDGAEWISEGLKHNSTLKTLYFNNNKIGSKGLQCICEGLKQNTTLRMLLIDGNEFGGPEAVELITDALKHNTTLEKFDISCNKFSKEEKGTLQEVANSKPGFQLRHTFYGGRGHGWVSL